MGTTQQISITLPREMADMAEQKVRSGAYASVSEVMRDGLQALIERDATVERWLRDEVVRSCEETAADPSRTVPIEDALPRIKARSAKPGE